MEGEPSEVSSGEGKVTLRITGAVAHVQFDRPWGCLRSQARWLYR
jgi:hypothetical protein